MASSNRWQSGSSWVRRRLASFAELTVVQKMEDMIALNLTALTRRRVRNASPRRLAQKFLPVFCRAGTAQLSEHSREVLLRFEAAGYRHIEHTHLGATQHLLGAVYPAV